MQVLSCANCGRYRITEEALAQIRQGAELDRGRLAAALYDRKVQTTAETEQIVLNTGNIRAVLETVPRRVSDRVDRLLLRLSARLPHGGASVRVSYEEGRSMAAAANQNEYLFLLRELQHRGYVSDINDIRLTVAGWARIEEFERNVPAGRQAFVAMNFANELDDVYFRGIKPAIEATQHTPLRLKDVQHAGKIDDRIMLEIARSRFMVADFTGQRQSVYYEAGYAQALGKTVIWTCRENETAQLHFDTRQYAHIVWSTPENLLELLANRIRVIIP